MTPAAPSLRLSVITICRNAAGILPRTCASLRAQRVPFQWVVIDGASSDGSPALLAEQVRAGDILLSEPDRGIADAFNKGLARATGDAVLFMNAGDEFASPDSLGDLVRAWDRSRHRWIVGAGDVVGADGRTLFRRGHARQPADPFRLVRWNCQIMHQAVLAERSLFTELGGFDERWRIAMDYELWVRWLRHGHVPQTCLVPVCRFHRGGASGDPVRNVAEERAVRERHGIANSWLADSGIALLARTKRWARGRYGRWLYRVKERLGVRL